MVLNLRLSKNNFEMKKQYYYSKIKKNIKTYKTWSVSTCYGYLPIDLNSESVSSSVKPDGTVPHK